MIFPENIGEHLSIDEVSLSHGELYTFVTNKNGRCKKRTLVACIKGTKSEIIVKTLQKLPLESRNKVKEITLDMAKNMESAAKEAFPNASLVTDRFHVVKLAIDALQHIRVKLRWKELDKENRKIAKAKSKKVKYKPKVFSNGDTPKQLLARSKFILNKKPHAGTTGLFTGSNGNKTICTTRDQCAQHPQFYWKRIPGFWCSHQLFYDCIQCAILTRNKKAGAQCRYETIQ